MSDRTGECELPSLLASERASLEAEGIENIDQLLPEVYRELRQLAGGLMQGPQGNQTLQPTALVHEVYVKLADGGSWNDREHFFALAATVMRHVLADYARRRSRKKRGASWNRVTVEVETDSGTPDQLNQVDLEKLDDALTRLSEISSRQARIVEFRFLAGMDSPAIAHLLGVSRRTVELDWRYAKAWLRRELAGDASA